MGGRVVLNIIFIETVNSERHFAAVNHKKMIEMKVFNNLLIKVSDLVKKSILIQQKIKLLS